MAAAVPTEVIAMPARLEVAECALREVAKSGGVFTGGSVRSQPRLAHPFPAGRVPRADEGRESVHGFRDCVFNFQLDDDAMLWVPVSPHEIARYRREHFSNVKPGILPEWGHPVTVAMTPNNI